jgi:hypothetical protein
MAAPAKFGPELLVNTSFIGSQFGSVATALTNGTVVVTWANANGGAESI